MLQVLKTTPSVKGAVSRADLKKKNITKTDDGLSSGFTSSEGGGSGVGGGQERVGRVPL